MSFLIHRGLLKVNICAPEPIPKAQPTIACMEPEIRIKKIEIKKDCFLIKEVTVLTSNGDNHEIQEKTSKESDIQNDHSELEIQSKATKPKVLVEIRLPK